MGNYISFTDYGKIPEAKIDEFKERLVTLLNVGGMARNTKIPINGQYIYTLDDIMFDPGGDHLDFCFNYLVDGIYWEVGYSGRSQSMYSDKIGTGLFNFVVTAAYILTGLYGGGDYAFDVHGPFSNMEEKCIKWINCLFDENFCCHNWDIIKKADYLAFGSDLPDNSELPRFFYLDYLDADYYESLSMLEALIVKEGFASLDEIKMLKTGEKYRQLFSAIDSIGDWVKKYKEESNGDEESQIEQLLKGINYLINEKRILNFADPNYLKCMEIFKQMDSPAIMIKVIADIYEQEFWSLYRRLNNSNRIWIYEDDNVFISEKYDTINDLDFFDVDDLTRVWKNNGKFIFSKEMEDWFIELKEKYDRLMKTDIEIDNKLDWICNLLIYASNNYFYINPFTSFLMETILNLEDKRYLVLYKIFEEIIHDPKMLEIGSVLFVDKTPVNDKKYVIRKGVDFKESIYNIDNDARKRIKRYLGLIANKELRNRVFDFDK